MALFADRRDAGRRLAERLAHLAPEHPVVLALPRGGVPVAYEVARVLDAPLDVVIVRKLGVPGREELGMGAIGEGDARVLNDDVLRITGVTSAHLASVEERERGEVRRRAERYRRGRTMTPLEDRTVVVVDDGVATGATTRAALEVVRAHGARRVVLAVPVAPPDVAARLREVADEVVTVATPSPFDAIGPWYADFGQTPDREVVELLDAAASRPRHETVELDAGGAQLVGELTVPRDPVGVVVFAHGSGSSRTSPRNRRVAEHLVGIGLATLLVDLLTPGEAADRARVFDIDLLTERLMCCARWCRGVPEIGRARLGYFGASTGAAAALCAAAADPGVGAVVGRGGRPDLAMSSLPGVRAPTLLVVGSADTVVLELNRRAAARLTCPHELAVVPGATHLFAEPGALERVADLAGGWFRAHLAGTPS